MSTVMIAVAAMIVGLVGCTSSPDLSGRADEIGDVLAAMPGVETVETNYQHFDSRRSLSYRVTMSGEATDDEAADLASTFSNEVGSEFEYYNPGLTIEMSGFTLDLQEDTAVDSLRQQAPRLRELASSLTASDVIWRELSEEADSDEALVVKGLSGNPFDALTAIRSKFGSEEISVRLEQCNDAEWIVKLPFSVEAQDGLETALGSGLEEMDWIIIEGDHLTNLTVTVAEGPRVERRLRDIVDLVNSSTSDPWSFEWRVDTSSSKKNKLSTAGSVSVGACDYASNSAKEKDPSSYLTTEAIAVQDQLRDIYDTCN